MFSEMASRPLFGEGASHKAKHHEPTNVSDLVPSTSRTNAKRLISRCYVDPRTVIEIPKFQYPVSHS